MTTDLSRFLQQYAVQRFIQFLFLGTALALKIACERKGFKTTMKDYLKFFGGLTVLGFILLLLGHVATTNAQIQSFDGKGALLAGYVALVFGLILSTGGSLGLAYAIKKLLDDKISEPIKNRLKF